MLALAAGKWGAYLGVAPVFPIDVLLAAAAVCAFARWSRRLPPAGARPARWWPGGALAAFALYPVVRFAVGEEHSMVALRDFAPYGYVVVAFLVAWSVARSGPADRRRTVLLLDAALLFHLAWVGLVLLVPTLTQEMPLINAGQQLHFFDLRGGSDGTVVGVTAGLYLMRLLRTGGRRNATVVTVALLEIASMAARAALLSTALTVVLTVCLRFTAPETSLRDRRRRLLSVGLLPLCVLGIGVLMPNTTSGSKLLAGVGLTAAESRMDAAGIGTAAARKQAWELVRSYIADTGHRWYGVGFGPDYLATSGARMPLGNSALLRQPHNFFIGTYARLGLVGLAMLVAVVLAAGFATFRLRRLIGTDDLLLLAALVPSASLVSAAVGVELESPFGAVPFYWCVGILLAYGRGARRNRLAAGAGDRSTTAAPSATDTRPVASAAPGPGGSPSGRRPGASRPPAPGYAAVRTGPGPGRPPG
jgi:O-antigen ligase